MTTKETCLQHGQLLIVGTGWYTLYWHMQQLNLQLIITLSMYSYTAQSS